MAVYTGAPIFPGMQVIKCDSHLQLLAVSYLAVLWLDLGKTRKFKKEPHSSRSSWSENGCHRFLQVLPAVRESLRGLWFRSSRELIGL